MIIFWSTLSGTEVLLSLSYGQAAHNGVGEAALLYLLVCACTIGLLTVQ